MAVTPCSPEGIPRLSTGVERRPPHRPRPEAQPVSSFETCSFTRVSLSDRGKLSDFGTKQTWVHVPAPPLCRALQGPLGARGFPGRSVVKNPPASAGDSGSIPGSERSLGEGNGNPLQYSCLGNPLDRGAWRATVHGVAKESDTT